jgi:four helix bundle protein
MAYRDLNVLDAAERVAVMVNQLIERSPRGQLLHVQQLRDAVQAIAANITEGFGRATRGARDYSLRVAHGETEEAICHMRANFRANRVEPTDYWPIHNLLVVISKMLAKLLRS